MSLEETQIYNEVEKIEKVNEQTGETKAVRSSWNGTITFDIPSLNWKQDFLHVSMGKAQASTMKMELKSYTRKMEPLTRHPSLIHHGSEL